MAFRVEFRNLCRICLTEDIDLVDILTFGESTEKWIEEINTYYNVQIRFNEVKSTKLCLICLGKIKTWRKDKIKAIKSQVVIDFLDTKVYRIFFYILCLYKLIKNEVGTTS
ncbi:ZAD domain-containing protein [Aphis craccivora]|uniref:ZAD domain-containing protein n=1 Tax=Aphis craccivora TaxID=307492 RepID=A0A6G0YAG3_APHCR|nr:ZAD domain-containing protein [Aphis craccivora]